MHGSESLEEADRLMTICNSCRYCEGLCAVFPAMELRQFFNDGNLNYLANLCHNCGACFSDCQYSPPHEFAVNIPRTMAEVREDSYRRYAWPAALRPLFKRNGLFVSLTLVLGIAVFLLSFLAFRDPAVLFSAQTGRGAFYRLIPHGVLVAIFGATFLYALLALFMGLRNFWRDIGGKPVGEFRSIMGAIKDAATLRYLDGGGGGCVDGEETLSPRRRVFHHLTFYGFVLCFASTSVATLYHYLLGLEAPYPWYDLPVLLGTAGGIGLVVGPIGLMQLKRGRDPLPTNPKGAGMNTAFLMMLLGTGATGLLLLVLRDTPAMAMLLAIHLGTVLGVFLLLPYSKFVHGLYRFAALVQFHLERRADHAAEQSYASDLTAGAAS